MHLLGSEKAIKVITLMIGFVLLSSCSNPELEVGSPITDFGKYRFADGFGLIVADENGLVVYELSNVKSQPVIKSNQRASVYQKWMLVRDGSRLWFSSSDIGGVVWIENETGEYSATSFTELTTDLRDVMPEPIRRRD